MSQKGNADLILLVESSIRQIEGDMDDGKGDCLCTHCATASYIIGKYPDIVDLVYQSRKRKHGLNSLKREKNAE